MESIVCVITVPLSAQVMLVSLRCISVIISSTLVLLRVR